MTTGTRRLSVTLAIAVALIVLYACGVAITLQAEPSYQSFTESIALPLDLMVFMPLAVYLFIIRAHKLTPLLVLPVMYLGYLMITQVIRPADATLVHALGVLAVGVDVAIVVREAKRLSLVFKGIRRRSPDPKVWFYDLVYSLIPQENIATLASTELMALYYAFFSWRAQPLGADGAESFSYHRKSGQGAFIGVLAVVMVIETVVVHLLLIQWSVLVATLLSVASVYMLFWLIGNVRASALRPVFVFDESVHVNSGIWACFDVSIAGIDTADGKDPSLGKKETYNLGTMGFANCWILLNEPLEIKGLYGASKKVRAIGLTLDDPARFRKSVQEKINSSDRG